MPDNPAISIVIGGMVQGVGFRWSCRAEARRLGLRGWVRNRPDGRVEAAAAGLPDALASFADWCRHGPPGAAVRECRIEKISESADWTTFEIRP